MKSMNWMLVSMLAMTLIVVGCSKSDEQATVNPAPVEKSFASAEPAEKTAANNAVALINAGNYQGALQELQKLSSNVKLTEEQKKAVTDIIAQIQKAVSEKVQQATEGANKALGDVQKSLGK